MDSKQKVLDALNHKTGKVPLDIGSSPTSGIHVRPLEALREYYGLEKKTVKVIEPFQMLGLVEDDLKEAMGIDTDLLWNPNTLFGNFNEGPKEWRTPWGQVVLVSEDLIVDEVDGVVRVYAQGDKNYEPSAAIAKGGYFFDACIRDTGFDEDNLKVEDNTEEFAQIDERTLDYFKREMENIADSPRAVVGNFGGTGIGDIGLVPAMSLKTPKGIRDVSEWYMATITQQDFLHRVFKYQIDVALENLRKIWDIVGQNIQVVYICGNDFGTQNAPFCSTATFEALYMPHYKRINSWIHKNTTWKTFKHSCGSIAPLIPSLIEAGFDILNPVQWSAQSMDRHHLKKTFGSDIVFWGGGINTQSTLPFGTPQEVEAEALECCEIFAKDGGFVFSTIHNITAEVPAENIAALAKAVRRFNGGQ